MYFYVEFWKFGIQGYTENNILPWFQQNKSEVSTLAGTKFFKFIGRRSILVTQKLSMTIYDYYKSMVLSEDLVTCKLALKSFQWKQVYS